MSLYNKYGNSQKGDNFRVPENIVKYSDVTFQNRVKENHGNRGTPSVMSNMMDVVKSERTYTTSQIVTATNPGTVPGSR